MKESKRLVELLANGNGFTYHNLMEGLQAGYRLRLVNFGAYGAAMVSIPPKKSKIILH